METALEVLSRAATMVNANSGEFKKRFFFNFFKRFNFAHDSLELHIDMTYSYFSFSIYRTFLN